MGGSMKFLNFSLYLVQCQRLLKDIGSFGCEEPQRNPHGQGMVFDLQQNKFKYLTFRRNVQFDKYPIFFEVLYFYLLKGFSFHS